jgi:hypothetical protein
LIYFWLTTLLVTVFSGSQQHSTNSRAALTSLMRPKGMSCTDELTGLELIRVSSVDLHYRAAFESGRAWFKLYLPLPGLIKISVFA